MATEQDRAPLSGVEGVLVIDKPKGMTSHDVVAVVRRILRERRVGHTGTLDPMATGVLPLVVGRATRLARFLSAARKRYEAVIALGIDTDTFDAEGSAVGGARVENSSAPLPPEAAVRAAAQGFLGTYAQVPPAYSAKKIGGVAAHRLARRGEALDDLPAVEVTVHALSVDEYVEPMARLTLDVSSGFYVRSLAHELGQVLGCGAHLAGLRRLASGEFDVSRAVSLEGLDAEVAAARHVPLAQMLPGLPAVWLTDTGARRASHGNAIAAEDVASDERSPGTSLGPVRLMTASGELLGVAEAAVAGAPWPLHPSVVLT